MSEEQAQKAAARILDGWQRQGDNVDPNYRFNAITDALLACAAHEREECAKVADRIERNSGSVNSRHAALAISSAIRARGDGEPTT